MNGTKFGKFLTESVKWVNKMGVYSSLVVYPTEFDEIDGSECDNCDFECDIHGYCKHDCLCGDCTYDCHIHGNCIKEVA